MNDQIFEDLITFSQCKFDDAHCQMTVTINPSHTVFEGHFPEQPVLPGVIVAEIFRRATQRAVSHDLKLKKASNIKFLKMIDPLLTPVLTLKMDFSTENLAVKTKGSLSVGADVYAKIQATFDAV